MRSVRPVPDAPRPLGRGDCEDLQCGGHAWSQHRLLGAHDQLPLLFSQLFQR